MQTTTLGRTGLRVSRVALGTWQLGGDWGGFDDDAAIEAIRRGREAGITLFDTAQGYGFGVAEELLGRALRADLDHRRDEVVIATKGGLRTEHGQVVRDSSPQWIRQGVDGSLRALGVDHLDLYQVHWPDPDVPLADTAGALRDLVDAGKVLHVGVSNFDVRQTAEFGAAEAIQPPYSLVRRGAEADVLPYAREHDLGVLVYGPLAHGLLTGALTEETTFGPDDWRSRSPLFHGDTYRRHLRAAREVGRIAGELGLTPSQLAIAWALATPAVHAAIAGSRRPEHVEQLAAAGDVRLAAADVARVGEAVTAALTPVGAGAGG